MACTYGANMLRWDSTSQSAAIRTPSKGFPPMVGAILTGLPCVAECHCTLMKFKFDLGVCPWKCVN
jgi:hypothetical protein